MAEKPKYDQSLGLASTPQIHVNLGPRPEPVLTALQCRILRGWGDR